MNIKRRVFLKGSMATGTLGVAAAAGLLSPTAVLAAWPEAAFKAKKVDEVLTNLMGSSEMSDSAEIKIKAPDIAENGTVVPISVTTTMSGIESIAIVVANNPSPLVASFNPGAGAEGFVSTLDIGASRYEMHYSPLLDGDGHLNGTIGVAIDNTERKEYEDRLIRQANFDDLTGLPNRNYMLPRLGDAFARARRQRNQVALLFLDLDNFKTINDTLGHRAGDELLVLASERMRATLRESDTMFRMSGDEFLVCLEGIGAIREVEVVARKLNRIFASPFALASGEVYASVSIGICLFPDDGTDVEQLMQAADAAMYGAKARGRNTFQLFTRQMREEAEARLAIESQLRRALGSDEFSLVYQPKVEVHSGRIVGAEALLRW
ncbi:MAG: hypothetical protein B0D85_05170, partial [Candidatus Sedimenticola endophacoides]